jgi:hypothetical protein
VGKTLLSQQVTFATDRQKAADASKMKQEETDLINIS